MGMFSERIFMTLGDVSRCKMSLLLAEVLSGGGGGRHTDSCKDIRWEKNWISDELDT